MNTSQGVSLIELIVAIAVIAITFIALISTQVLSLNISRDSREVATARDIAGEQLENIRSHGYTAYQDCPTTSPDTGIFDNAPTCNGSQSATNFPSFTISWTVTNQAQDPNNLDNTITLNPPPLVQIDIVVTGGDITYELTNYISCADAGDFSFTNIPCPLASMR